jgi:hypothetical protein
VAFGTSETPTQRSPRKQDDRIRRVRARILTESAALGLLPASVAEDVPEYSTDDDSDMEDMFQKVMSGEDIVGPSEEPLEDPFITLDNARDYLVSKSSHTL